MGGSKGCFHAHVTRYRVPEYGPMRISAVPLSACTVVGVPTALALGAHVYIMRCVERAYGGRFSLRQWASHLGRTNKLELLWRMATATWRCVPDVVIVGEQKAGTTALTDQLDAHPDSRGAFFCWGSGSEPFGWLNGKESQFLNGFYGVFTGKRLYRMAFPLRMWKPKCVYDATPHSLVMPYAAARLHAWAPHAKIIAIVRNPTDRAFSQFQMYSRFRDHFGPLFTESMGRGEWTFEAMVDASLAPEAVRGFARLEAVGPDDPLPADNFELLHPRSLIRRGMYAKNIQRYLDLFGPERVLVLRMEDLDGEALAQTMGRVYGFLGIQPIPVATGAGYSRFKPESNRGLYKAAVDQNTRRRLDDIFHEPNAALDALLAPRSA